MLFVAHYYHITFTILDQPKCQAGVGSTLLRRRISSTRRFGSICWQSSSQSPTTFSKCPYFVIPCQIKHAIWSSHKCLTFRLNPFNQNSQYHYPAIVPFAYLPRLTSINCPSVFLFVLRSRRPPHSLLSPPAQRKSYAAWHAVPHKQARRFGILRPSEPVKSLVPRYFHVNLWAYLVNRWSSLLSIIMKSEC